MIYQGKARYPVSEIILHCADTLPEWMAGRPLTEKVAVRPDVQYVITPSGDGRNALVAGLQLEFGF